MRAIWKTVSNRILLSSGSLRSPTVFISQNTIEGRIAEVLEKKRQLFEDMLGQNGPPPSLGLNEDEIFGLFNVKARPKRSAFHVY